VTPALLDGDLEAAGIADRQAERHHIVFNSSQIPGEILDLTVLEGISEFGRMVGSRFAKALTGAWYENDGAACRRLVRRQTKCLRRLPADSQDTPTSYKNSSALPTILHATIAVCVLGASELLKEKMGLVAQFCFDHGLLGTNTKSVDEVAIALSRWYRAGQTRHRVRIALGVFDYEDSRRDISMPSAASS